MPLRNVNLVDDNKILLGEMIIDTYHAIEVLNNNIRVNAMTKTITLDGIDYTLTPIKMDYKLEPKKSEPKKVFPQIGDVYWYVDNDGCVDKHYWSNHEIDNKFLNYGNCFRSKATAEKVAEALRSIFKIINDAEENCSSPTYHNHDDLIFKARKAVEADKGADDESN